MASTGEISLFVLTKKVAVNRQMVGWQCMLAALMLISTAAQTAHAKEGRPGASPKGLRCHGVELVSLMALEPRPLFELRYASPYNFLERTLYSQLNPRLRCPVAQALEQVQRDLASEGLGLMVWDAYRPLAVQQMMWDAIQDPRYVSDPAVNAGRHTRGTSVDVTLVDQSGKSLVMPTDFDDFSENAHIGAKSVPAEAQRNAQRLREAMERRGFTAFPTEWWHFDWKQWTSLPVVSP